MRKSARSRKGKKPVRKQFWHKQYFVLDVDVFRVQVGVAVNLSEAEIKHRMEEDGTIAEAMKEVLEHLDGWDEMDVRRSGIGRLLLAAGAFVVTLKVDKQDFRSAVGILVHEMTHVTQYLLRHRRVPLTEDTEEVHAYLVEYLVEAALREMY